MFNTEIVPLVELKNVGYQGCCPEPDFALSSCGAQKEGSNPFPRHFLRQVEVRKLNDGTGGLALRVLSTIGVWTRNRFVRRI